MRAGKGLCYIVAVILLYSSCDSSEHELDVKITNSVNIEKNAMINCILESITNEVEFSLLNPVSNENLEKDSIPTIKVSQNGSQDDSKNMLIDYGTSNQIDYLGHLKRGKIYSEISGDITTAQSMQLIYFDEFYINDLNITGQIEIQTIGFNSNNCLCFDITYDNIKFVSKSGKTYTVNGNKTKEWIRGFETQEYLWDDIFLVNGFLSGINSEERNYTAEITSPLVVSHSCEFISEGEISFVVEKEKSIYNFGEGKCDNKGFFTRNGEQSNFEFGRYEFRYDK